MVRPLFWIEGENIGESRPGNFWWPQCYPCSRRTIISRDPAGRCVMNNSFELFSVNSQRNTTRKRPSSQGFTIRSKVTPGICWWTRYSQFSQGCRYVERFIPGLLNYRTAPPEHWRRIRTTNMIERLNKELKRRTRAFGAFANNASLLHLAGILLIDINEEWITSRRYLCGS